MIKSSVPTRALILLLSFGALLIVGCSCQNDGLHDRTSLINALHQAGALSKERQRVHMSHTCNLEIGGALYPVMDIRELVRGASVPRGINHILVLDPSLIIKQKIEYTTERPLYCSKNQLFVYGDLMIDGLLPEGNVLTFSAGATQVTISNLDMNRLPGEAY